uniref:Secreted protein n=1 Tax=Globodera pallida TaxID=36090 RepID=A0A183BY94_GLOPA
MAALIVLVILIGAAFAQLDSTTTTAPAEKSTALLAGIETTEMLVSTTAQPTTQTTELTGKLVSTTGENEGTSTTQAQTQPTELTTTMKHEELTTLKKVVFTCTSNGGQVGAEPFIRPVFVVIVTYVAMLVV